VSFEVVDNSSPAPYVQAERFCSADAVCADVSGGAYYRNARRELLAKFAVYRKFCYNGYAINVPGPATGRRGRHEPGGQSRGRRYQGVVYSSGGYFTYKGRSQAGHKTVRTASFKVCPEGAQSFKKVPKVAIYVNYDGFRYPRVTQ